MIPFWFLLMLDKYKVLIGMNGRQCQYVTINNLELVCLRVTQRVNRVKVLFFKTVLTAMVLFGLSACGQSGALYMPQDAQQQSNQESSKQEQDKSEDNSFEGNSSEENSSEQQGSSQDRSSIPSDVPETKEN